MTVLTDYTGLDIRLPDERLEHVERHPEMEDQLERLEETLWDPDDVRVSDQGDSVVLYDCQIHPTTEGGGFLLEPL